jgi:beta-phosphoglucomutase-like phosphatase (HAD superfamily)
MAMLKVLIFDVDGTLADTEHAHLNAFNQAFAEDGLDWVWDEALYTQLLHISGGKERIWAYWQEVNQSIQSIDGMALEDTIDRIHAIKTAAY